MYIVAVTIIPLKGYHTKGKVITNQSGSSPVSFEKYETIDFWTKESTIKKQSSMEFLKDNKIIGEWEDGSTYMQCISY